MKDQIAGIKNIIFSFFNYGVTFTDDRLLQKKVQNTNIFGFCLILYYFFLSRNYLSLGNQSLAITTYIVILKILVNLIIFKFIKKIRIYSFLLILILTIEVCKGLTQSHFQGIGLVGVVIIIIVSFNIMEIRTGSIISCFIILFEVFVYLFNKRLDWIYDYPDILNLLLIRSIGAHIGFFIFAYIGARNHEKLFLKLEVEKEEKNHLFVNIVHDIKTPLTIIRNSIDKCINNNKDNDSNELLKSNIIRMEKSILNILNIERFKKGFDFVDESSLSNISVLTKDICNYFTDYSLSRGLKLNQDIESELYVAIDDTLYMEVLNNLLDNAIKYTESGGEINVSLYKDFDLVKLLVKDNGIGIPESDKDNVFNKYYQAHKRHGSYYGLGIGLTYVKKICEAFNGRITLESKVGTGTEFCVEFPGASGKKSKTTKTPRDIFIPKISKEPELSNINEQFKCVLIVEDNIDIRNLLIQSLKNNYNVLFASNGEEGLELCRSHNNIDLILSDIMMPVMDGREFITKLRSEKGHLITPIIFLTAKTDIYDTVDYISLGAIDFITKPFSIEEVVSKVDSILSVFENKENQLVKDIGNNIKEFISENLNSKIINESTKNVPDSSKLREFSITRKEEVIISELWRGLTIKEIAEKQNLSVSTVKTHIYRIYKKCNVKNSTSLVKLIYNF